MRKTIDKLQTDPSKAEEIQFLETVAESIPDDAYLTGLFTERFVNFVAQKIRDDWYCDFMDMYQSEINNATDAERARDIIQAEFGKYRDASKAIQDRLHNKIDSLNEQLEIARTTVNGQVEKYWELRRELDHTNGQAMRDVAYLKSEKQDLEQEIVSLKAKMYDMQEKIDWLEQHVDYDSIQED